MSATTNDHKQELLTLATKIAKLLPDGEFTANSLKIYLAKKDIDLKRPVWEVIRKNSWAIRKDEVSHIYVKNTVLESKTSIQSMEESILIEEMQRRGFIVGKAL